jgi:lysophospholipase L1-like esterase
MGEMQGEMCGRPARRALVPGAAALLAIAAACGGGGPIDPTPVTNPPTIACPSDVSQRGVTGGGQAVSYPSPTTTAGSPPVTVSCTPSSGSTFPIGATPVSCVARDAQGRQATCGFSVSLSATALTATRFVAFGDSVTEGQNGRTIAGHRVVDTPNAYPTRLQSLFDFEFPGQGITVINEGRGGASLDDDVRRLPGVLSADHPDALLLLHGYNDLGACPPGGGATSSCTKAIEVVVSKMIECIHIARDPRYGVRYVFVSTLTPPGPTGDRRRDAGAIGETNARLTRYVPSEGAILVDSYREFLGHEAEYVDIDGLHLRPAGNEVLARMFFSAITTTIPANSLGIRSLF